jgi:hypothetical protein
MEKSKGNGVEAMKAVKTNELEPGMFAAHVMDLPNCGGIQVARQGTIERIEATDMWGTVSEIQQTIWFKPVGGDDWSTVVITVHNSHNWLVRTR